ncbi:DNA polymerase IV [bioreactor metagenome]|uniref:DNA polymerase IV n=1 Tax=bioreactor metagenome TaxID=1076179 RepID=A0A645ISR7_9ZZZZ
MRKIYLEYSDRVEAFGLDENWVDLSNPGVTIEDGERIANIIRNRVREELGLTISVGVSFNKIFAKLGSDLKKPDATTVIRRDNFKEKVWPLPVSDLLYVGR